MQLHLGMNKVLLNWGVWGGGGGGGGGMCITIFGFTDLEKVSLVLLN